MARCYMGENFSFGFHCPGGNHFRWNRVTAWRIGRTRQWGSYSFAEYFGCSQSGVGFLGGGFSFYSLSGLVVNL